MIKYIQNKTHYTEVLQKCKTVKRTLWIGTADIKDVYVKDGLSGSKPFLSVLNDLLKSGVEIRLLYAKDPGPNFREDFDKYPLLAKHLEQALCPRVHFKIFVFDSREVYIGSANLTGAGIGMKGEQNRNFEAGILTDLPELVEPAISQFDEVWNGSQCTNCGRKKYCPLPIAAY